MRDTLLGAIAAARGAGAGVVVAAEVGACEAVSLRGVLLGRLLVLCVSSMGSYTHVASCSLQLAHVGFSALHLI